ncbi:MAG: leucyl/phenylalanyl-tRNA--protein transferase [Pseudomonadota bacterium]
MEPRSAPKMQRVYWVRQCRLAEAFPATADALEDPNGLLAIGGDLSTTMLCNAYKRGIFPWYSDGQPILWWAPDPRCALNPSQRHASRSLRRAIRRESFEISFDMAFESVVDSCRAPRRDQSGTWITDEMREAYLSLHRNNIAHSIECWRGSELAGGLYGVSVGGAFFGESMFSNVSNASKATFVALCDKLSAWGYTLFDCQIPTSHLESLGAETMTRRDFETRLAAAIQQTPSARAWTDERFRPQLDKNID